MRTSVMSAKPFRRWEFEDWSALRTARWPEESADHRSELEACFAGENPMLQACLVFEEASHLVAFIELSVRGIAEGSDSAEVARGANPPGTVEVPGWLFRRSLCPPQ